MSNAVGFYLSPLKYWIGKEPFRGFPDNYLNLQVLNETQTKQKLTCGLKIKCDMEGLFILDFSEFTMAASPPQIEKLPRSSFEDLVDYRNEQLCYSNCFIAILHTRIANTQNLAIKKNMLSSDNIHIFKSIDDNRIQLAKHRCLYENRTLWANKEPEYEINEVSRAYVLETELVIKSIDDFNSIFLNNNKKIFTIIELILRSTKAIEEHNFNISTIFSWATIEYCLAQLWKKFMKENKSDISNNTIIDAKRQKNS